MKKLCIISYATLAVLLSMLLCACQSESSNYQALHNAMRFNTLEGVKEVTATASQKDIDLAYQYCFEPATMCKSQKIRDYLVEQGANLNFIHKFGYTPLMGLAASDSVDGCDLLLQHGADINMKGRDGLTALELASLSDDTEDTITYLISKGAIVTKHSLDIALEGNPPLYNGYSHYGAVRIIVMQLLKQGDETGLPPIVEAAIIGDSETVLRHIKEGGLTEENLIWVSCNVTAFGSAEALEACAKAGFSMVQSSESHHPYEIAIRYGNMETTKWIMEHQNEYGGEAGYFDPVEVAAQYGQNKIAEYLLGAGYPLRYIDKYTGSLLTAARKGNVELMDILLRYGHSTADDMLNHVASSAVNGGNPKALEFLLQYFSANPAKLQVLQASIRKNLSFIRDIESLKIASQYGVDMIDGFTLNSAVERGDYEMVHYLLGEGNDVNYVDEDDNTPLYNAVTYGFLDIVELLIKNGADMNYIHKGFGSILGIAAKTSANITQCLLDHGADVNIQDDMGFTPLMEAVYAKRADCVKILLDAGADVSIEDNAGRTATSLAGRNKEMLELLA